MINLETVLAKNPAHPIEGKKYPTFDHPRRTLAVLKKLGVTAVNLANNHTMDYGPEILTKMIQQLTGSGIQVFGAGVNKKEASRPLRFTLKGVLGSKKVYVFSGMRAAKRYKEYGFFADNRHPGVNFLGVKTITAQIERVREKDQQALIIVFPHWQGFDYQWISPRIQEICTEMLSAGADYVIGQGTHMVNHIQYMDCGTIFYSIGNFVYNSPGRYKKMKAPPYSFVVQLEIAAEEREWAVQERVYPIFSDNRITDYAVRPVTREEGEELQSILYEKNSYIYFQLKKDGQGFYYLSREKTGGDRARRPPLFTPAKSPVQQKQNRYEEKNFSTKKLLAREFKRLGYKTELMGKYVLAYVKKQQIVFFETESTCTSLLGWRILKDKALARRFFLSAGLSVARGEYFEKDQQQAAWEYAEAFSHAVVKPSHGRKGRGITVGVQTETDFLAAWETAKKRNKKGILVEEQFTEGIEARYLVVRGRCIAVFQKHPPVLLGNGVDSLEQLLEKKNRERTQNPHLRKSLIHLDPRRLEMIRQQGFTLSSIPEKGEKILIDWKSSISSGGDTQDITAGVHPLFKGVAQETATAVPGLDIVGVDILAHDHTRSPTSENHIIIEANTRPNIGGHHYPLYGTPRNVARIIVEETIKSLEAGPLQR